MPPAQRLETLKEVWRRLKPGAPLVAAHHSFARHGGELDKWLARNAAYAVASGVPQAQAQASRESIKQFLPVLSAQEDEALLVEAGFCEVELFYAALTFKGWVARKPLQ